MKSLSIWKPAKNSDSVPEGATAGYVTSWKMTGIISIHSGSNAGTTRKWWSDNTNEGR